jgi:OPA family glycerol-3-phosphate transporter-like MFS transporter
VRETFNLWTPTYLTEAAGLTVASAAFASSLFPFFGGLSSITSGYLSDSILAGRRGLVIVIFLLPSTAALLGLAFMTHPGSVALPLLLISAVGFFILGPYTFLTGAVSVDLGGKRGSATAAGLADTAGYIGSYLSGKFIGSIADTRGWTSAFLFLAMVLAVTTVIAAGYWYFHEHRRARAA